MYIFINKWWINIWKCLLINLFINIYIYKYLILFINVLFYYIKVLSFFRKLDFFKF